MKGSLTALVVALFSMGSLAVYAQAPGESGGFGQQSQEPAQSTSSSMSIQDREFSELDADGDGRLTQQEAEQAGIESVTFESLDQDGDGEVNEQDFDQAKEAAGSAR